MPRGMACDANHAAIRKSTRASEVSRFRVMLHVCDRFCVKSAAWHLVTQKLGPCIAKLLIILNEAPAHFDDEGCGLLQCQRQLAQLRGKLPRGRFIASIM